MNRQSSRQEIILPKESKTKQPNKPTTGLPSHPVEDQKALAFVTLLSSQETDTHHRRSYRTLSGATHLTYHPQPACQPPEDRKPWKITHPPKNPHPGRPPRRRPASRSSGGDPHLTVSIRRFAPDSPIRCRFPARFRRLAASRSPWGEENITFVPDLGQIRAYRPEAVPGTRRSAALRT
jgi:hypothetical protein